jgi:hypothetical protein
MREMHGPDWLTMETARLRHEERLAEAERDHLATRATAERRRWWWPAWWGRPGPAEAAEEAGAEQPVAAPEPEAEEVASGGRPAEAEARVLVGAGRPGGP